jgi:hypothetical protein
VDLLSRTCTKFFLAKASSFVWKCIQ